MKATPALRVAVIGCGRMGAERAGCAAELGASVDACVEVDVERARRLAARFGARAAKGLDEIDWSRLDATFVCTPPSARSDAVMRAVDSGVAVMVEKPIGLSAGDGRRFAHAAAHGGVINAVGYMNRYRASVRLAREVVARGSPVAVMCHWACRPYGVPWWHLDDWSGGPFNEQATHLVDLCRFIVGEVDGVEAIASRGRDTTDSPTRVAAALHFACGALGTLIYTCDAPDKFIGFEAVTGEGAVRLEGWDFVMTVNTITESLPAHTGANPFTQETEAFLGAVAARDGSGISSTFDDATRTQSIIDAIRDAIR